MAGDDQALADLYVRCRETMLVRVARIAPERTTADLEDVVAESLLEAIGVLRAGRWNPDQGSFLAWLDRVVRHDLLDAARRTKRRPEPADPGELDRIVRAADTGPATRVVAAESEAQIVAQVRRALVALHARYADVLLLRAVLGLGVDAVAEELRITRRQVIDASYEGRRRLFAALERGEADWEVFVRHVEHRVVADTKAAILAFVRAGAPPR